MRIRRSARFLLLILAVVTVIPLLLAGCEGAQPIQAISQEVQPTQPPAPTTTLPPAPTLPPTWTPTPGKATQPAGQPRITVTPTATFNIPQTAAARATEARSIQCEKYADAWQIRVEPSWREGWCQVRSQSGQFYQYQVLYPEAWKPLTFGEITPNLYFNTGQKNIDVRLLQIYHPVYRPYQGSLQEAPVKAAVCDENDKCTLVIDLNEKIIRKSVTAVGAEEVMVVDSTAGSRNIRRYFFFVGFRFTRPQSNRLFVFTLETPDPITDETYVDLQQQIKDMIVSVQPDL
jgi:hypothetical protein